MPRVPPSVIHGDKESGIEGLPIGPPVPHIPLVASDPDTVIEIELMRINLLLEKLVESKNGTSIERTKIFRHSVRIGDYINPSVIPFQGQWLGSTGSAWWYTDGLEASETILFRVFNPHGFSNASEIVEYPKDAVFFGVSGREMQPLDFHFLGQDPRMVQLDENSVLVAYTNRYVTTLLTGNTTTS